MCSALVSRHGFKNDVYFMCSALVSLHDWELFSVSRELTSGESDRLLPGRTVSIRSDWVCLPTSSTLLAHFNILPPVPLIKCLVPISGSGRNRTQSACWWRQPDSGRVYWLCVSSHEESFSNFPSSSSSCFPLFSCCSSKSECSRLTDSPGWISLW